MKRELDYTVYASGEILANAYLPNQPVVINNPDASFILTGITGSQTDAFVAVLLRDHMMRGLANEPIWLNNLASSNGAAAMFEGGGVIWPPASTIVFDVRELSGAGGSWELAFWGYLRFEEPRSC